MAVTLTTLSGLFGRFALTLVADTHEPRRLFMLSVASQAAALTAVLALGTPMSLMLACCVYGSSAGNLVVLPTLIVQREYERGDFAIVIGMLTAVMSIASGGGPGAIGFLHGISSSYFGPLAFCILLNCLACACMFVRPQTGRPRLSKF